MNPSKYEGSILEDDIEEEPFTIVEKKDMKTLEQVIREASEDFGHPAGVVGDEEASVIASAVREWMRNIAREPGHGPSGGVQGVQAARIKELEAEVEQLKSDRGEWMREQNEGLRKAIYNVLVDELPADQNSLDDCREYTNAILSVIPPPRDEMFKTALAVYESRIKELETGVCELSELCSMKDDKLAEIKALLDKLRPIRKDQESRIEQTKTHISNGLKSGNGHYIEQADGVLSEFLDEMQKAKAIHAEIDSIIEQSQISQMEEQRKEFDNDAPFPDETIEALKEFTKRSSEATIMIGGRPVSTGISPAEADDLDAMLKLHLANQRGLTKEEHRELSQFMREQGEPMTPTEADGILIDWANKRIEILEAENKRLQVLADAADNLAKLESRQSKRITHLETELSAANASRVLLQEDMKELQSDLNLLGDENGALRVRVEEATTLNQTITYGPIDEVRKKCRELEIELARAHEELGHPEIVHAIREKAHKYDELRAKFPFLPGEKFYTFVGGTIRKCTVQHTSTTGVTDNRTNGHVWDECCRTVEECRSKIPMEGRMNCPVCGKDHWERMDFNTLGDEFKCDCGTMLKTDYDDAGELVDTEENWSVVKVEEEA